MENYESKLLSINTDEVPLIKDCIAYAEFSFLESIKTTDAYECALRKLAEKLPYKTFSWPSFGQYREDWYRVEVGEFRHELQYCERGSCQVRESFENLIDLSYQILKIVSCSLTPSSIKIAEALDRIKDQRLLIWLRMSSEICHMFQINHNFGMRMLKANVTWMCEELVRMRVFNKPADAFKSEKHIVQGLTLSGLSKSAASQLYNELKNT
ncbi:hypothetical protein [Marinicellulosiphila megalodicopiae]|uniref:hypothetical protein n=1 Tax=Marinicellulosiphila megalodicopiae TaxID=2724896 RepID=UPI003BAE45C2